MTDPDLDEMCPNCVTPWKCNGPHLVDPALASHLDHRVEWVAECRCATKGGHYQGFRCLDCNERLGSGLPCTQAGLQE